MLTEATARTRTRAMIELYVLAFLIGAVGTVCAEDAKPAFPVMAPIEHVTAANEHYSLAASVNSPATQRVLGLAADRNTTRPT